MRFLERFLVVFALIGILSRVWHVATAPVFILAGFAALAMFYLAAFPFVVTGEPGARRFSPGILWRMLTGLLLAYSLAGFGVYLLGWISKADVLGNCCIGLSAVLIGHWIYYFRTRNPYSVLVLTRAGLMLLAVLACVLLLPGFQRMP